MYDQNIILPVTSESNEAVLPVPKSPIRNAEDDAVYFCGSTSEDSFAGPVEDGACMTNNQIIGFARSANPELFNRLFGGLHEQFVQVAFTPSLKNAHRLNTSYGRLQYAADFQEHNSDMRRPKRWLITYLLNSYVIILQKLVVPSTVCCDHLGCDFNYIPIPIGTFTLELRALSKSLHTNELFQSPQFCLTCIEALFESVGKPDVADNCTMLDVQATPCSTMNARLDLNPSDVLRSSLDGPARVAEAAERLMPPLCDRKCATETQELDFPFNHRSNSPRSLELRRKRHEDIQEILLQVGKYEKRRKKEAFSDAGSPSLTITAPLEIPTDSRDRYRKQHRSKNGQRQEDYVQMSCHLNNRDTISGASTVSFMAGDQPICYCDEPTALTGLVYCSSDFCLIGKFHLRCSGLKRCPLPSDFWRCSNCREYFSSSPDPQDCQLEKFKDPSDWADNPGKVSSQKPRQIPIFQDFAERGFQTPNTILDLKGSSDIIPAIDEASSSPLHDCAPAEPNKDGFVAINQIFAPNRSLDGVWPDSDYSRVGFADLAPFMVAETCLESLRALEPKQVIAFKEWKASCPPSKLVRPLTPKCKAVFPEARAGLLSSILSEVEAEMTLIEQN